MDEKQAEIFSKFRAIVAQSLRIDEDRVTLDSRLDDLGAESIDMIEITMECESAFQVWLPEKTILQSAEEVLGEGTVVSNGYVTEEGKRLLAQRMRPEEVALIEGELPIEAVHSHFMKVGSWVQMLANLIEQTPTRCSACNGDLKASTGFRLQCKNCGTEVTLRSGEDINRDWLERYREERDAKSPMALQATT